MRILFIRHGEAVVNTEDTVLTPLGIKQAKALAKKLSELNITNVYCSELTRAKKTCEELISLTKDLTPIFTEELNEIYRVIVGGPEKEGTSVGREKRDRNRAESFYKKIKELDEKGDVAIFCHGNIIRFFMAKIKEKDPKTMWEDMEIGPATAVVYNLENKEFEKNIESGVEISSLEYL